MTIEQGENESLWSFITHFNREALSVDEVDDKLLLTAFYNGVNSDLFIYKLYEKESQSMVELIHSAQNFMNAEDAIIAKKRKRSERVEANPSRIRSKVLVQRKDGRKRGKTEIIRSQALQCGTSNIPY